MSLIYNKTDWKDDKSTPVNAKNLNNIEDGVEYIYHKWDKIIQDSTTGDHAAELIDARYGPNDIEQHPTLGHRLNHMADKFKEVDSQLEHKANFLELEHVNVIDRFGVVGDGISDDTLAIQNALDSGLDLYFPNKQYRTSGNIINRDISIYVGGATFLPLSNNQEFMISIKSRPCIKGKLVVNGEYKCLNGLQFEGANRTQIEYLESTRCKAWGVYFKPAGNNNAININYLKSNLNGTKCEVSFARIDNKNATINNIPSEFNSIDCKNYYLDSISKNVVFSVKAIEGSNCAFWNDIPSGYTTGTGYLIIGGGVGIVKHGDNGCININTLDVNDNKGSGVEVNSQYGLQCSNLIAQANTFGVSTREYSSKIIINSAYFELNKTDVLTYDYNNLIIDAAILEYISDNIVSLTGKQGMFYTINSFKKYNVVVESRNPGSRTFNEQSERFRSLSMNTSKYSITLSLIDLNQKVDRWIPLYLYFTISGDFSQPITVKLEQKLIDFGYTIGGATSVDIIPNANKFKVEIFISESKKFNYLITS